MMLGLRRSFGTSTILKSTAAAAATAVSNTTSMSSSSNISMGSVLSTPQVKLSKDQLKKRELRRATINKRNARKPASDSPVYLPLPMALRYLRAAEVGFTRNQTTLTITTLVVSERGNQPLRGKIFLPHSLSAKGDSTKIMVFVGDESKVGYYKDELNCETVGGSKLVESIKNGSIDVSNIKMAFATPDIAPSLNKELGRILGPKGLLPTAKRGTVAEDLTTLIRESVGAMPFQQKRNVISVPIGKVQLSDLQIAENILAARTAIMKALGEQKSKKPSILGQTTISSTHGPGIVIDFK
ncbi:related to 54S ribosomal protein L1, mitochondrial [Saccharomycodes ludwigii]|uniref:Related to 54S ribosomal protein L1, mitochondrial n=1 Tax=Saccharomycodes ludwigii TaxID=36035 RepID=A0A376BBN4_9ASCO|nr:hypothetical protein SCDLUD_001704 [Saccharomycodes ludwigii]KAH3901920.1 hypothetical protein SCDLUD_001704 [Saccharomycodes ludwigii]SSD61550.1 related to 54S ribosomal protein L1, mitochondrial [Saccharomycodes ludwigii]